MRRPVKRIGPTRRHVFEPSKSDPDVCAVCGNRRDGGTVHL